MKERYDSMHSVSVCAHRRRNEDGRVWSHREHRGAEEDDRARYTLKIIAILHRLRLTRSHFFQANHLGKDNARYRIVKRRVYAQHGLGSTWNSLAPVVVARGRKSKDFSQGKIVGARIMFCTYNNEISVKAIPFLSISKCSPNLCGNHIWSFSSLCCNNVMNVRNALRRNQSKSYYFIVWHNVRDSIIHSSISISLFLDLCFSPLKNTFPSCSQLKPYRNQFELSLLWEITNFISNF